MGFLSKFEGRMEDTFEGAADKMFDSPISPVQIAKKAEKQMKREKMVGAGKQYAPTLYTVLVNPDDDRRLFGYYPTLAGETETYLAAKASEQGLVMDGQPLVRFIVDEGLKHGKFDIIAEAVAAPIIAQLRDDEMQRYGLAGPQGRNAPAPAPAPARPMGGGYQQPYGQAPARGGYGAPAPMPAYGGYDQGYDQYAAAPDAYGNNNSYDEYDLNDQNEQPLPYVPENELDRSIDYGEYTFNSRDFDEQRDGALPQNAGHVVDPFDLAGASMAPAAGVAAGAAVRGAAHPNASARPVASDTVVFAGGAQGATPVPAQRAVRARLVDTANNRAYDLASARLFIGRESKNDIPLQDINASRVHAELRFEPQGVWVLTDLGSTNGTLVNGREITSLPLTQGDLITIGVTNLAFTQA